MKFSGILGSNRFLVEFSDLDAQRSQISLLFCLDETDVTIPLHPLAEKNTYITLGNNQVNYFER